MRKFFVFFVFLLIFPCLACAGNTYLSGAVMDKDGHFIENAMIMLYKSGTYHKEKESKPAYVTTTNSDGVFLFQNLSPGVYDVICKKNGYHTQKQSIPVIPYSPQSVYFRLSPSYSPGWGLSSHFFFVHPVDLKTARVYVAFTSDKDYTSYGYKVNPNNPANPIQSPFMTSPAEMGGILYGANPMQGDPLFQLMRKDMFNQSAGFIQTLHPDNISILDSKKNRIVASIPTPSRVYWLAFSPGGKRFWTIDQLDDLTMYSRNGKRIASVNLGNNIVSALAVSPNGNRVYLAVRSYPNPEVLIADGVSNSLVGSFPLPADHGQPGGVAVSADGRILAVTMGDGSQGWLEVLNARTGQMLEQIQVGAEPIGVGVTPYGTRAVVADYGSSTVDVVDLTTGRVVSEIQSGLEPSQVAMRSDGRVAFVTNHGDNTLSVIEVNRGVQLGRVPVGKGPMGVAVSQDGRRVYVANQESGNITIINGYSLVVVGSTTPVKGIHPYGIAIRP
jgi:YVTN family beta-propeller protein